MSSAQTSDGAGFQMQKMPRMESYLFMITDKVWDVGPYVGIYVFGLIFDIAWLKYLVLVAGAISQPPVLFILLRLLHFTLKALYVILIELLLFRICPFVFRLLHKLIPNSIYVCNTNGPSVGEESSWIDDPLTAVNPSRESQEMSNHMVYNSWRETNWRDVHHYQREEGDDQCSRDQSREGSEASEEEDCPDSENYQEVFQSKHELEREMQCSRQPLQGSRHHHTFGRATNTTSEACNSGEEYPRRQQKYVKQASCNEGSKPTYSKPKRFSLPHSQSPLHSKPNIARHSTHIAPQGLPAKVPNYQLPTRSTLYHVKHSQTKPSTKRDESPKRVPRMPTESRETQVDKRRKSMNFVPLTRDASSSPKIRRALSKSQESLLKPTVQPTRDISPRPESPRPGKKYNTCSEISSDSSEHPMKRALSKSQEPLFKVVPSTADISPRPQLLKPRTRYNTCCETSSGNSEHLMKEEASSSQKLHRKSTGTLGNTDALQHLTVFAPPADTVTENTDTSQEDTYQPEKSEAEVMSLISNGHDSFMKAISSRKPIMDYMREQYTNGNIQGALDTAIQSGDGAVIVNLFSAVMKEPDALNLNIAITILPVVKDLISRGHEYFVVTACELLRLILVKFNGVIQGNIHRQCSIGVDIAQEERTEKSVRFYKMVVEMCDLLDDSHSLYDSMSMSFKELKLLISMLD